jgi:hypothetical protein
VPSFLASWETHPSWARGIASPALHPRIEAAVGELLGVEDVLAFSSLTQTHNGVLPALAGEGTLLVDNRGHRTLHDTAVIAQAGGATVRRFRSGDLDQLERLLRRSAPPRVVCMDGVNPMTGNPPDVPAFAALAREHDATLYLDDTHGFGVIGERGGYDPSPYGRRGNGVVRWFGESYDHVVLTAGFSKAYSSLLAFVAVPTPLKQFLKVMVPTYVYGGPCRWPRWPRRCWASRSTSAGATSCAPSSTQDPDRARPARQARRGHLQRLRAPADRAGPGRPRGPACRRPPPVRPGRLRDAGPYPVVPGTRSASGSS